MFETFTETEILPIVGSELHTQYLNTMDSLLEAHFIIKIITQLTDASDSKVSPKYKKKRKKRKKRNILLTRISSAVAP